VATWNIRRVLLGLLIGASFCTPSWAQLFSNNVDYYGYVSAVQPGFIFVLTSNVSPSDPNTVGNNQFVRIMFNPGDTHPDLFPGQIVHVVAAPGSDGQNYLVSVQQLDANGNPLPAPPGAPTPTSPSNPTSPPTTPSNPTTP
jgi:hypothetical protein